MNIFGWQLQFRKSRAVRTLPFDGVLLKVRTMREGCAWPPATPPATIEQRTNRILAARRRVNYRPISHEWVAKSKFEQTWDWWHWVSLLLVLVATGVVLALYLTRGDDRDAPYMMRASYQYSYAVAPAFLSESMAIEAAFTLLTQCGLAGNWRTLVQGTNHVNNLAPDGSREVYLMRTPTGDPNSGVVVIESDRDVEPALIVRLQLQGNQLTVTVAPAR